MLYGIAIALLPGAKPDSNELRVWNEGWTKPQVGAKPLTLEDARKIAQEAEANTLNTQYIVRAVIINATSKEASMRAALMRMRDFFREGGVPLHGDAQLFDHEKGIKEVIEDLLK